MEFSSVTGNPVASHTGVFLSSALIHVQNDKGDRVLVRALIGQCSESSFISNSVARKLSLKSKNACNPISSVGGHKVAACTEKVEFTITPHFKSEFACRVVALIISNVSSYLPPKVNISSNLRHLLGLNLADPEFTMNHPVEVLLGADMHAELVLEGIVKGQPSEPIATASHLGWYISGKTSIETSSLNTNAVIISHHCAANDSLSEMVQNFWRQEEIPKVKILIPDEEECERHFIDTTTRDGSGRYVVYLPFKQVSKHKLDDLGDSYSKAMKILLKLEHKFKANPEFETLYKQFMRDYLDSGHVKLVRPDSLDFKPVEKTYFLPHHDVLNPTSTSTKLRTVFNGSSKTTKDISINDLLHTGENLLPELPDLISNWRIYKNVFVADVQQMFRQIRVNEEDVHYQAIVWHFSEDNPIEIYYLLTVTYGLGPSALQALRTVRLIASVKKEALPMGSEIAESETYMDDALSGGHTFQQALLKQSQLIQLLESGGLNLRKWLSNHPDLLNHLPSDHVAVQPGILFKNSSSVPVLGINWQNGDDHFQFDIVCHPARDIYTKRLILSHIAQIFDPMGWIAPIVVTAKIFMQSLWLLKCDWDDLLPYSFVLRWREWYSKFDSLKSIKVPRYVRWSPEVQVCEIHGFADASQEAFEAVIYLRIVVDGFVYMSIQNAKTRVAPLKTQSNL